MANGLVYRVEDYGAVGNGVTDDGAAIALAISTAVAAGGGIVYLGPKTYNIGSTTLVLIGTLKGQT